MPRDPGEEAHRRDRDASERDLRAAAQDRAAAARPWLHVVPDEPDGA